MGLSARQKCRRALVCVVGAVAVTMQSLVVVTVSPPAAFAMVPSIALNRTIQTKPFVGTSTSIKDNEGLAYVPANNQMWLVDDSTDKLYAFDKDSGVLGQTFSKSQFAAATRFGRTDVAGSDRFGDGEAVAYDDPNDTLYVFSGSCCTSSAKPTVFRLTRASRAGAFVIDSWQPLNAPYNDLSGVGARGSEIWAGAGKDLVRYDYVTNTATSPRRFPGIAGYLGIDFDDSGSHVWVADKGNRVKKYDFATGTLVPGFDFAMSSYNCLDARAVEVIGNQIFVSDGYDYYGSVSTAFGVRVYDLGGTISAPVAAFTATPAAGAAPLTVAFTDTSTSTPTSWNWNFGDGTSSASQHPTHVYATPGNYDVRLTATNSAGSDVSDLVTIAVSQSAPVASFTKSVSSGAAPLTVAFTDTSTNGPTSWEWDFDDGGTSTQSSPSHTFADEGSYDITLTATNTAGSDSVTHTIVVSGTAVVPEASFVASANSGNAPLVVNFTDTTTHGPTSWSWNFGDGSPLATVQNPTHTFTASGVFTVALTSTNSAGSSSSTQTVTSTATSTVHTVIASEDAYVTQSSPDSNRSTGSQIYNLASATGATRGYVKFAVAGVAGTVTSAKLRLWVTDGTDNGAAWWIVANSWTEAAVTWTNGPMPTTGVLAGDPAATVAGNWLEIDVTGRVGGNGTYSFASLPTSTNGEKFSTREGINPPQLVIVTG